MRNDVKNGDIKFIPQMKLRGNSDNMDVRKELFREVDGSSVLDTCGDRPTNSLN
jgi:hypothetical protein